MSVSLSQYKYLAPTLGREIENFPRFMMVSAPSFAISLHWDGGSVSQGFRNSWARIRQDEGDFYSWSWKFGIFSLPYPRNGENYLFPYMSFEISSIV